MDGAQFFQGYTEQLQGDSLLYITPFLKSPGTHLIELGGWKAEPILEPASSFKHGTPGLGMLLLHKYSYC